MKKTYKKIEANEKYVKEIVTDYEALSERCDEVDVAKDNKLVQEIVVALKNTIRANDNMLGLSANQIGYNKRIVCLNFNNNIRTFVNPIITNFAGMELSREKCHSIGETEYIRLRNSSIDITFQTPLGNIQDTKLVGLAAVIMQHHIDHLDGLLISDVGLEILPEFDAATEEERQEVINMYLDSLDMISESYMNDVEETEEGKQLLDAVKFIQSVQKGETIVERVPMTEEEIQAAKKMEETLSETEDETLED